MNVALLAAGLALLVIAGLQSVSCDARERKQLAGAHTRREPTISDATLRPNLVRTPTHAVQERSSARGYRRLAA